VLSLRGGAAAANLDEKAAEARQKLSSWWASAKPSSSRSSVAQDPEFKKALGLMKSRGLANVEKAVTLLRQVHHRDDSVQVKLELADALNTVMRIKTNANCLVLEGTQDTPANKKLWRALGNEALPLATAAYKAMPGDVRALAVYADSFMYSCSAKGIVKQAVSGTAKEYKRMANELRKYPKWDGAVGNAFLGGFYNVAPWPVGNKKLAAKYLGEGAAIAPTRRNLYYVGINAYQTGDFKKAVDFFGRATKAACGSITEEDFGAFLLQESKKGLKLAQAALTAEQAA